MKEPNFSGGKGEKRLLCRVMCTVSNWRATCNDKDLWDTFKVVWDDYVIEHRDCQVMGTH